MRAKLRVAGFISLAITGCAPTTSNTPTITNAQSEGKHCLEIVNGSPGKCSYQVTKISKKYAVKQGRVYVYREETSYERPCDVGPAALFGNILSIKCMRSEDNAPYFVDKIYLDYVTRYSPELKALDESQETAIDWQKEQLANYVKDEKVVYWRRHRIESANPKSFSVLFPLGDEEAWKSYSFSKSGNNTFLGDSNIGEIDWNRFKILEPVRCPRHGLTRCATRSKAKDLATIYGWGGIVGVEGRDVIFITSGGITRYPGMASDDVFIFATYYQIYLHSNGKFYEFAKSGSQIIDMDLNKFESHSYLE